MFSPSTNGNAATNSVRSSRRRPRPLSNEGNSLQPKAKRQRSALSEQTFLAPNGDAASEMEEVKGKVATLVRHEVAKDVPVDAPKKEIVVRGKKVKSGERSSRGDGSVTLTANDIYTVSKLPALPDRLRADVTTRQHGAISSDTGYALTLTHAHCMVWPYAANIPSPETFTFTLPHPSKHTTDALPLASLVSASASSQEPGLVVVMPTSGIVTYWESIATAATLDLIRQQRNGVEYTIPGMLSGESVVQILNAESAGFVLGFSSGRLAYMSVRDREGRPAISVQFLRGTNGGGGGGGGIFGSLRNALSISAWRGDIAAVRAGPADKVGERNMVVATEKGKLQAWNLHRDGHNSLRADADGREDIVLAIKAANPAMSDFLLESFEVLDFTFTPKPKSGSQLIKRGSEEEDDGTHLLLLTSLTDREASHYSLVEVVLKSNFLLIGTVRTIRSYTTPISRISTTKTRLYLPNPALMAFIVFDKAVVVTSMAKQPDSPENQLRAESHIVTKTFEDVVDFREDLNVEIVGSGMEEAHVTSHSEDSKTRRHKAKHPATVLLVRGGGVVRVAATDISKLITSTPQVTAKSKLEQAVFFGTLEKNPLSFSGRLEQQFEAEEIGLAALELSMDILRSNTEHIPSVPASIEQNLKKRASALQDLALHLKSTGVTQKLNRVLKWRLMWDAEKMAAAAKIWRSYDSWLKTKPDGQKRGLLNEMIEFIHEDYKTMPVAEAGELDRIRLWFIKDIWNMQVAIPWAYQVIKYTYQDGKKDHAFILQTLSEANDVVAGALKGAFDFRAANLKLYGLQSEKLQHGILQDDYEDLPEFWTSTFFITDNVRKQADLAAFLVRDIRQEKGEAGRSDEVLEKLRLETGVLIDLAVRSNTERLCWDAVQDEPQLQIQAEELKVLQANAQHEQLTVLADDLELPDEAIALAEKHSILPTLAEILMLQIVRALNSYKSPGASDEEVVYWRQRANSLQTRAENEFDKFGTAWANALYEYHISIGAMGELLDKYQDQQAYLTSFLRSRPEYAKVAWINEVCREKDYDKAAETLLDLGTKREQHLWSKKIELSLGKLARLAGKKSYSQSNGLLIPDGGKAELVTTHDHLALIKIQDRIYEHIFPVINNAIDENAELQLAMESYGSRDLLKTRAFASFLEEAMENLLRHNVMNAGELIDLLTLMNISRGDYGTISGQQFYLALQASKRGLRTKDDESIAQQVIWRRCFLKDNWSVINNTDQKDDEEVSEQLRGTALYSTLKECLKNRLFDPETGIKPLGPHEVVDASTEDLDSRFNGLDASIRESIMKDMHGESASLEPLIKKYRLEKWHQSALDLAKLDFEQDLSNETKDGQSMREVALRLEDIEKEIKANELRNADNLLHSRPKQPKSKLNGSFRMSTRLY